nr:hypothetical protein [Kribbella sp. VKM Ac-2566]
MPGGPRSAEAARATGDGVDEVVVLELRPLRRPWDQMQDLAVPDAMRTECASEDELRAVQPAQHPATVRDAFVGEVFAGLGEQAGEDLGDRRLLRESQVDAALGRHDCHPDQTCDVHGATVAAPAWSGGDATGSCRRRIGGGAAT